MKMFTDILERSPTVMWRSIFENARRMKGMLLRVLHVVSDGLSTEYCIAAYLLSKEICRIRRKSGLLFTALYVKQCAVVLQKYYGEGSFSPQLLSPYVSLTKCGLPRIIPSFHRKTIRSRNSRGDVCVKVYLSWFSVCRVVLLAPAVSKATFSSLVEIAPNISELSETVLSLFDIIRDVIPRYLPHLPSIPLHQGMSWAPTWKSLPNRIRVMKKTVPSIYGSLLPELDAFSQLTSLRFSVDVGGWSVSMRDLFGHFTVFGLDETFDQSKKFGIDRAYDLLYFVFRRITPSRDFRSRSPVICPPLDKVYSRVAASMAGAGKRRLFIIGNYGVQRLLKPYHDWFMTILRTLPNDGTYNQHKPITCVLGSPFVASYDLKSATDRWPRPFLTEVVTILLGFKTAMRVVELCLGIMPVRVTKPLVKTPTTIRFNIGTPLGFYSAWPIFSLSHHILIWSAAEVIYPGKSFHAYGILGDDLIIGDRRVAEEYSELLSLLGVSTSPSKSLISNRGALEFAKKFFFIGADGRPFDASPVSIRMMLLARTTLGLSTIYTSYSVTMKSMMRIAGAGYRVMAKLSPLSVKGRWNRLIVFLSYKPGFTETVFEWWLSGWKRPINPYLKGKLFWWLLSKVRPKQLILPTDRDLAEMENFELTMEFSEYTVTRSWCASWLRLLLWYSTTVMECRGDLTPLLSPPIVEYSWQRRTVDREVYRYGLVWRLFDRAGDDPQIGIIAQKGPVKEQLHYPVIWRVRAS